MSQLNPAESNIANMFIEVYPELVLRASTTKSRRPTLAQRSHPVNVLTNDINYGNYTNNAIILKSYTVPDLKHAAKTHKLPVSGTKQGLIDRIELHFLKIKHAINIERVFRGHIVRRSLVLRGPAIKDRSICVNDTDFITMEPLTELDIENFYSYTDKHNFTYGFNITSLIQSMQKQNKVNNPYNREKMDGQIATNIITLYKLSFIIYPDFKNNNDIYNHGYRKPAVPVRSSRTRSSYLTNAINMVNLSADSNHMGARGRIAAIRVLPMEQRIQNLFMEIDQLGNYTQSTWFTSLDVRQYIRLYRVFCELWNYRAQLSYEVKSRICPFPGPFEGMLPMSIYNNTVSPEDIMVACLCVIENLVYSGVDEDHRKLGTFHALSALTVVSVDARTAMPWLYESIAY